ncbi:flowering-promoting factor 1-like protein 1 [Phragmites australis]|uniref:flowering-promoting factor 1-like protein 1 n=1 Tax=Phragmites australis TaxID=29695 RepID=UPI002D777319|nr:flowering-promoting factor 1-like protein 1 [Phragmites australis]
MSGVWVFKNGVVRLVENGAASEAGAGGVRKRKALVHTPSGQVVRSYTELEGELRALGWERYYEDPALYQFHKRGSLDLISLPADFSRFSSVHMYDIVIKNRDSFRVVDI